MSHVEQLIVILIAGMCAIVVGFGFDWRFAPAAFALATAFFAWIIAPDRSTPHE